MSTVRLLLCTKINAKLADITVLNSNLVEERTIEKKFCFINEILVTIQYLDYHCMYMFCTFTFKVTRECKK